MHDFLIFFASAAFGGLAWAMLVAADWLLGDDGSASNSHRKLRPTAPTAHERNHRPEFAY